MRSSISASKSLTASAAIAVLLGALALWFVLLESSARLLMPRHSAGLQRIDADYRATLALRPTTAAGSRTVLFLGNSLLLSDVVRTELQSRLAPRYAVAEFPLEGTTFFDWYFGLRRLFAQGARPAVVIVCLNFGQLLSDTTHGAAFAWHLMTARDLTAVKRAAGLNLMTTSDYLFAHISSWFGTRSHVRVYLLERLLPHADLLASYLAPAGTGHDNGAPDLSGALQRLRELQQLCSSHGAGFALLIPPTLSASDPGPALAAAAAHAGIPVLMPYQPAELPRRVFADGFHLDPQGAELFTARLTQELPAVLVALPD